MGGAMRIARSCSHIFGLLALAACASSPTVPPPQARAAPTAFSASPADAPSAQGGPRVAPVVDDYFGEKIADPYRWMEQPNSSELAQWMEAEGTRARRAFDAIPGRAKLFERILQTGLGVAQVDSVQLVGETLFYFKVDKGADLKKLVMRGRDGVEHVLVDPEALSTRDSHASIDHFSPSPDGRLVAYGIAPGGGEICTEHVLDTKTGRELPDQIEHIWGEFPVSWLPDGRGFFYTQMASEGFTDPSVDKSQKMRALTHHLGEPTSKDHLLLGYGVNGKVPFEPQEFPYVRVTPGSSWALALGLGAHHEQRVYVARLAAAKGADTAWARLCDYSDGIEQVVIHGDDLFLLSNKGASNKRVLRVSAKSARLDHPQAFVAESDAVVESIDAAADALYVTLQKDGRSKLRRVTYTDGHAEDVQLPFDGWIDGVPTDPRRAGALVKMEGWTREDAFYTFNPRSRAFNPVELKTKADADFSQIVTEEVSVLAADGVQVPLTILRRRDLALDGSHPAMVIGYGAYGIAMTPTYRPYILAWLERGGIWAIAHVRGGGEKGDAWRKGAWRQTKPNSWRDFNACAEWLVQKGFTSKSKLAAYSGSAGGILIGRAITERPDLYAAAGIYAGMVNALRYSYGTNGANQTAELGTPDTPEGYRALRAMDAYASVKPAVAYPALVLATGMNDARVSPWMSAKLAARMQAATSSGRPVLLRIERDEGHGVGSRRQQRFAIWADTWSFFLQQMGDPEFVKK